MKLDEGVDMDIPRFIFPEFPLPPSILSTLTVMVATRPAAPVLYDFLAFSSRLLCSGFVR
jgi:hypothetical protein